MTSNSERRPALPSIPDKLHSGHQRYRLTSEEREFPERDG